MYKFHGGSELDFLKNLELSQICLGQYETQIVFSDVARISMEGKYIHRIYPEGKEIVRDGSSCGPNELFRLLGQSVSRVLEVPPDSFELLFSNGDLSSRHA